MDKKKKLGKNLEKLITKCKLKIVLESALHLYVKSLNGTLTSEMITDSLKSRMKADIIDTSDAAYTVNCDYLYDIGCKLGFKGPKDETFKQYSKKE